MKFEIVPNRDSKTFSVYIKNTGKKLFRSEGEIDRVVAINSSMGSYGYYPLKVFKINDAKDWIDKYLKQNKKEVKDFDEQQEWYNQQTIVEYP